MKIHRIFAIVLRYTYLFMHSFDRLTDAFYWPALDLFVWGLTSVYFRSFMPVDSPVLMVILSGIVFWLIVWRGQYEISVNLLEDLWNKNLVNIFVSPLKFSEWVVSFLIIGFIKAVVSLIFTCVLAFLLYKFRIFIYGFYIIPFFLLLILTGWWVGFFVAGIVLRFGTRVQTLAWATVAVLSPFSAVYYPISVLPQWGQKIAMLIPTSYIFEGVREVIATGILDPLKLIICLLLNIIYLTFSLIFLRRSFSKILEKGLIKVY